MKNNKISIQELIGEIAAVSNCSKKDVETFLKAFVSSADLGLTNDGLVKIKGLGTLKLQWNEPRKSVNVRTGEEYIIPGHNRIAFVAEPLVRDRINAPYAGIQALNVKGVSATEDEKSQMAKFHAQAIEIKGLLDDLRGDSKPSAESAIAADTKSENKISYEGDSDSGEFNSDVVSDDSSDSIGNSISENDKSEKSSVSAEELASLRDQLAALTQKVDQLVSQTQLQQSSSVSDDDVDNIDESEDDNEDNEFADNSNNDENIDVSDDVENDYDADEESDDEDKTETTDIALDDNDANIAEESSLEDESMDELRQEDSPEQPVFVGTSSFNESFEQINQTEETDSPAEQIEQTEETGFSAEQINQTEETDSSTEQIEQTEEVNSPAEQIEQTEDTDSPVEQIEQTEENTEKEEIAVVSDSTESDNTVSSVAETTVLDDEEKSEPIDNYDLGERQLPISKKSKTKILDWVLIIILVICLGLVLFYIEKETSCFSSFFSNEYNRIENYFNSKKESDVEQRAKDKARAVKAAQDALKKERQVRERMVGSYVEIDASASVAASRRESDKRIKDSDEKEKKAEQQKKEELPEIITEFKLKEGQRLTTIAEKYYGSKDYWVYIYEFNKSSISDPDAVKIGTNIRVPRLGKDIVDINNPETLTKAHNKAASYKKK